MLFSGSSCGGRAKRGNCPCTLFLFINLAKTNQCLMLPWKLSQIFNWNSEFSKYPICNDYHIIYKYLLIIQKFIYVQLQWQFHYVGISCFFFCVCVIIFFKSTYENFLIWSLKWLKYRAPLLHCIDVVYTQCILNHKE